MVTLVMMRGWLCLTPQKWLLGILSAYLKERVSVYDVSVF